MYEKPDFNSKTTAVEKGAILKYAGETADWYVVETASKECYISKSISKVLETGQEMYLSESVSPLPIKDIQKIIDTCETQVVYDDYSKQKRIMYRDSQGSDHLIWVEDEESMEKRLQLVRKYRLPGAAAWMLTHETDGVWEVIKRCLK